MPTWVITGTNRGLGLEFVNQLSQNSSNSIIACVRDTSKPRPELDAVKDKSAATIEVLECDTGSPKSIAAFALQLDSVLAKLPDGARQVDFLLNNAGVNAVPHETALTITEAGLTGHLAVSVLGPAKMVQELQSHFVNGSVVMNMTSGLGSIGDSVTNPGTLWATYSISKAAVNMLTVHQAKVLKEKGVTVICIDPGWVKTDMGGPAAPLESHESVSGILKVIKSATLEDTAKFYLYDGSNKPW